MFRGSEQVHAGLLTAGQLRSSAWQRLFPDVYACSSLPATHERRARAVARLLLPGATVSGRRAAVLRGVDAARSDDPVECTLPSAQRGGAVRGVHVTRRHLPAGDVTRRHGVLVTTPMRTALDLARIQPTDASWPESTSAGRSGRTVVFVTAADLRDPAVVVARFRAALDAPGYA